jgi:hypothetical protein
MKLFRKRLKSVQENQSKTKGVRLFGDTVPKPGSEKKELTPVLQL